MTPVQKCEYCGLSALTPICGLCESEIASNQRKKRGRLRTDCPLHPGKSVYCQTFGHNAGFFNTGSKVCSLHWLRIHREETDQRCKKIDELENRPSTILFDIKQRADKVHKDTEQFIEELQENQRVTKGHSWGPV